jgi:hypothetical protein
MLMLVPLLLCCLCDAVHADGPRPTEPAVHPVWPAPSDRARRCGCVHHPWHVGAAAHHSNMERTEPQCERYSWPGNGNTHPRNMRPTVATKLLLVLMLISGACLCVKMHSASS